MIRFKVVKASKLLLWAAVILLVAVVVFIMARYSLARQPQPHAASASLVEREAETETVFASTPVLEVEVVKTQPRSVLIYHTHTHEAYEQVREDPYVALEAWRTADAGHSVLRVGEELARCLRAEGFEVVHDTTDHENDMLSTAYTRSPGRWRGMTGVSTSTSICTGTPGTRVCRAATPIPTALPWPSPCC